MFSFKNPFSKTNNPPNNSEVYENVLIHICQRMEHIDQIVTLQEKLNLIKLFINEIYNAAQLLNIRLDQSLFDIVAQNESICDLWPKMETEEEMNTEITSINNNLRSQSSMLSSKPKLNLMFWMLDSDLTKRFKTKYGKDYRFFESDADLGSNQTLVIITMAASRQLEDKLCKVIKGIADCKDCLSFFNVYNLGSSNAVILRLASNYLKQQYKEKETLIVDGTQPIQVTCETIFYNPDSPNELLKKLPDSLAQLSFSKEVKHEAY